MNLQKWINEGRLQHHTTNKKELENLFELVTRDLKDAKIKQLLTDRRFATAYNAALQLSTIALLAAGYRVKASTGHHWVPLLSISEVMGEKYNNQADYFNACRAKRNMTDYDRAGTISEAELKELLEEVSIFKQEVINWILANYPKFKCDWMISCPES